jgi:hypothetical protein
MILSPSESPKRKVGKRKRRGRAKRRGLFQKGIFFPQKISGTPIQETPFFCEVKVLSEYILLVG